MFEIIRAGYDDKPELYAALERFVSERVWGKFREFGQGRARAIVENGTVIAAVIFNNYDEDAGVIEISAASDSRRWLTRPVLKEIFDYPFNGLGCQAVVARGDSRNSAVARIFPAYGFKRYDIPRLRGRDTVEAIYVLTDDDWRKSKFHKGHAK